MVTIGTWCPRSANLKTLVPNRARLSVSFPDQGLQIVHLLLFAFVFHLVLIRVQFPNPVRSQKSPFARLFLVLV